MSLSKLLIAFFVLAGLGGVIWWVNKNPQDKTAATAASPKLLDVPDSRIQSVEIQKKGGAPLILGRDKGKWTITAPEAYAADQDASVSMVSSLSGVTADSVIDDNPGDASKYGFAAPSLTVTVHEKTGKTDRLIFGDDVPTSSLVYVRVNQDPKVYAASASLKSGFSKESADLRDKRLLTFDNTHVSRIEIIAPGSDIEFGKADQADWQIVKPQPYRADSFQVDDIVRKLGEAKMDLSGKPEDAHAADAAFKSGRPVASVSVTDAGGVQSLDVRQNKEDYYAHSSVVAGAFKISADLGKLLSKPLNDFRNRKIFDFAFSDVNKLEVHGSTGDKVYVRSGTDWKVAGQIMDPGSVQTVIDKLRDLSAGDFPTTGFNQPDITITVVSNENKRTEKVEFSKTTDGYLARREGQPALYKLDGKSINDILEAVKAVKPPASGSKK